MKRLMLVASFWVPLTALALGSPGCGNACDDLADICGDCTDADYQQSCEATVADGNQEVCSFRLDELRPICVGEPSTSSSGAGQPLPTGSGGAGAAGGATASGGAGTGGDATGGAGTGGTAMGGASAGGGA